MAVFLNATEARSSARANLTIFDEVRTIERAVLVASDNGDYETVVIDTTMTNTVIDTNKNFHDPVVLVGSIGVAVPAATPYATIGHVLEINTIDVTFTGTTLTSVVNDINAAFPLNEIVASAYLDTGLYYLRLYSSSGDPVTISNSAGTPLTWIGMTAGTYQSITTSSDTITITAHGFLTGDKISFLTAGVLPTGLTSGYTSVYYAIKTDNDNFKVATTLSNALNNIPIDLVNQGTGIHSVKKTSDSELYFQVFQKNITDRVRSDHMNQVIAYFESLGYVISRVLNTGTGSTFYWSIQW